MKAVQYYTTQQLKEMTANRKKEFSSFFQKMKKKKPPRLDQAVHALHDEAFSYFNCLDCANCCASISPIITDKDAGRLARKVKMKPSEFISRYLYMDEDQDYVFRQSPCPFLMADNCCSVYQIGRKPPRVPAYRSQPVIPDWCAHLENMRNLSGCIAIPKTDPGEDTYRMIVPTLGLRHSVPLPGRFAETGGFHYLCRDAEIILAIDGHSSWGTSTVARELAAKCNYLFLTAAPCTGQ